MTAGNSRRGFSVNVFLPTGDPEGLKVVEKSNWSGRGLVIPRPIFGESRARDELTRTGVYILVGPSETSAFPTVYVGEGDPVRPRLEQHVKNKEFWTHAVVFTSKDTNLNKAHVQRLESRLVELATRAKRCVLNNGNSPAPPSLSEADEATTEGFLDDVLLCLPILGYSMFESGSASVSWVDNETLFLSARGIEATGQEVPAGFVVFAKSRAVGDAKVTESVKRHFPGVTDLRNALIEQQVLVADGEDYILTMDYTFSSPSMASSVVEGRQSNGRTEWKTKDGRTLKEIQETEASA
jgi:hypothetical protein